MKILICKNGNGAGRELQSGSGKDENRDWKFSLYRCTVVAHDKPSEMQYRRADDKLEIEPPLCVRHLRVTSDIRRECLCVVAIFNSVSVALCTLWQAFSCNNSCIRLQHLFSLLFSVCSFWKCLSCLFSFPPVCKKPQAAITSLFLETSSASDVQLSPREKSRWKTHRIFNSGRMSQRNEQDTSFSTTPQVAPRTRMASPDSYLRTFPACQMSSGFEYHLDARHSVRDTENFAASLSR